MADIRTATPPDVDRAGTSGYETRVDTANDGLAPGTEIFGYQVESLIGRGGMGSVYLAKQLSLGRAVALKVLHASRIRNPSQVDGFLREARAAGKLNHPHLLMVHAVHADPDAGLYCYSMEYVPGSTLSRLVKDSGALTRAAALHILYQIAKALGHAHRNGLIHRDVKPDNILVMRNGVAKLADLGLVRDRLEGVVSPGSGNRILSIVGTPDYSAPEQSRNPQRVVPASDVYSLGACLFFMLASRPPFAGETVIDLIVRAATEPLSFPPAFPTDCRALCSRMLAKQPEDRFVDGEHLVAALDALAAGRQAPPPVIRTPVPAAEGDDETVEEDEVDEAPPATGGPARRVVRRRRRRG